jgi:restriction endonuclease Mrr
MAAFYRLGRWQVSLPDYQTLMRPLLELHADGAELDRPTVRALLAEQFRPTPEELVELLSSGRQRKFDNRAAWATTYLVQAGLLERPRRGVSKITSRGLEILRQHHSGSTSACWPSSMSSAASANGSQPRWGMGAALRSHQACS